MKHIPILDFGSKYKTFQKEKFMYEDLIINTFQLIVYQYNPGVGKSNNSHL